VPNGNVRPTNHPTTNPDFHEWDIAWSQKSTGSRNLLAAFARPRAFYKAIPPPHSIPASTRMSHPASALYHGQGNTGSAIMNLSRIVAR
jgi:hypothetical protein